MSHWRTVALLARRPGLAILKDALLTDPRLELAQVFTHSHLPKSENGGLRPETDEFRATCEEHCVSFDTLDLPEARNLDEYLPDAPLDLLVACSWRAVVPPTALARFRVGAVNVHRGDLPAYAGAEPVRRAIEAGERRVAITAHCMTEAIDDGDAMAAVWLDVQAPTAGCRRAAVEAVKSRLVPLYAPVTRTAIAALAAREGAS